MSSWAGAGAALTARVKVTRSRVRREEKDFIVLVQEDVVMIKFSVTLEDGRQRAN